MIIPEASSDNSRNSNNKGVTSYLPSRSPILFSPPTYDFGLFSWIVWWIYGPSPMGILLTGCHYLWLTDLGRVCLILGLLKLWNSMKPLLLNVTLEGARRCDVTLDTAGHLFRRLSGLPLLDLGLAIFAFARISRGLGLVSGLVSLWEPLASVCHCVTPYFRTLSSLLLEQRARPHREPVRHRIHRRLKTWCSSERTFGPSIEPFHSRMWCRTCSFSSCIYVWLQRLLAHEVAGICEVAETPESPHSMFVVPRAIAPNLPPHGYPTCYFILSAVMLTMSFVTFLLAGSGVLGSALVAHPWFTHLSSVSPPIHVDGDLSLGSASIEDRPSKTIRGRRLAHLALLAAITTCDSLPTLHLMSSKHLKHRLRHCRTSSGFLTKTRSIQGERLVQLRTVLEESQCHLLHKDDHFEIIIDSGCSKVVSPEKSDFVPGSLVDLPIPLSMDGIAGSLVAKQRGMVRYEVLNDKGDISIITCEGYYLPTLRVRLLSPQVWMNHHKGGKYVMEYNRSHLQFPDGSHLSLGYHPQTSLPVIRAFHNVAQTAESLAMVGVLDDSNGNLTPVQKVMYLWHTKWGHLGWQHVKWLGGTGSFGVSGYQMSTSDTSIIKCASCLLGKQERSSKGGSTVSTQRSGILKQDELKPGDLVFSDQYESPLLGRHFSAKGNDLSCEKYRGGTIFCDAASGRLSVHHQVGLTGIETVASKLAFENDALGVGVTVLKYSSDMGVYNSKAFSDSLLSKGQTIRHSGVGAHHHNGVAENAIKNTVRTARTMMIHAALRWPSENDKELWPLALSHAVHLHNSIPSMRSKLSPNEIWSRSTGTLSALVNAHPWGCPVYVLDPRLQDGKKIPKWEPRSRQGQYMGSSPLHASTVGLVRNLRTFKISPQFHVVYDDLFTTVHADLVVPPPEWPELVTMHRFRSDLRDSDPPSLSSEWNTGHPDVHLTPPVETEPGVAGGPVDPFLNDRVSERQSPIDDPVSTPQKVANPSVGRYPHLPVSSSPSLSDSGVSPASPAQRAPVMDEPETSSVSPGPLRRNPLRDRRAPERYRERGLLIESGQHPSSHIRSFCHGMIGMLSLYQGRAYDSRYLLNLLLDHEFGLFNGLNPGFSPWLMKAAYGTDPDQPSLHEAMRGEHREDFLAAMTKEISALEKHGTWTVIRRDSMPDGCKALPGTWALKIKKNPDGSNSKFKARYCARGDKQVQNVDYFESYAPVASSSTVRMVMNLAMQRGWVTRHVDFSNAFVQANLKEEVYLEVPEMFFDEQGNGRKDDVVLKLQKSIYGLVQAPRSWYYHLLDGLHKLEFKPSVEDPGMYFGRGMILITYVDDTLFFGPDLGEIEAAITDLENAGFGLTREKGDAETAFAFLGINILMDPILHKLRMTQSGLIDKVLSAVGMSDCNSIGSPANLVPLGTHADSPPRRDSWNYASVIGMLMYLSANAHPEIQFAVHQCARFTHCPREIHEKAVKHICRYLKGAKGNGLMFTPTQSLELCCYVDADFAGLWNYEDDQDPVCVKSRTGYTMTLGGSPISWNSKLQTEIALSTTEAEYIALSQAMREFIPLRRLLIEVSLNMGLTCVPRSVMKSQVFEDNNGAIATALSAKMTPRTKHIGVKYHFFKSYLHTHSNPEGEFVLVKINTDLQKADIFTKGLAPQKFRELRMLLCGW